MTHRATPSLSTDDSRPVNLKDGDLENAVPLPDFMQELGVLLQLPKRRTTRQVVVIPEATVQPRRTSARSVALAVLALSLAGAVGFVRFGPTPAPAPLPEALRGEWRTSNPKYRERVLSFTEDRVGLSMAEGTTPSLHPITSLTTKSVGDTTVIALTYEDGGSPVDFRVSLVKGAKPLLWLSNPPDVVWEPVGKGGAAAAMPPAPIVPLPSSSSGPISTSAPAGRQPWEH